MKARIVRIGNSRGVRLPKAVLQASGLAEEVELTAEPDCVVIRSASHPRQGWEAQFEQMVRTGDDRLHDAIAAPTTQWDDQEWTW